MNNYFNIILSSESIFGSLSNSLVDSQSERDCDCACPTSSSNETVRIEQQVNTLEPDSILFSSPELYLSSLNSTFTFVFNLLSSKGRAVLGPNALNLLRAFKGGKSLREVAQTFFPFADFREVLSAAQSLLRLDLLGWSSFKQPNDFSTGNAGILTAWMHVTNKCNLRCPYCYLTKTPDDMEIQIGRQSVDAIIRSALSHSFEGIKLKFAGGESTLNFRLVAALQRYAQKQTKALGLTLQSVILSNGIVIHDRMIDFLKSNYVRLMISLDGVGQYHDAQRIFINGRGSFDLVSRNIERLIRHDIKPNISITISNRNLPGLPQVVQYVLERDLSFSLNFYRENDCSSTIKDLRYGDRQIIEAMQATFAIIERYLPRRSLLASLLDRTDLSTAHTQTCGVGNNYMIIDQDGHIAKCQMEIERPITSIHAPDPLKIIREDQIGIQNLPVQEKEGCRDCSWRYWCTGGCPLYTYRITGRYDVKSPNCNIYKTLFPEILRLEGLRVLKYYGPK